MFYTIITTLVNLLKTILVLYNSTSILVSNITTFTTIMPTSIIAIRLPNLTINPTSYILRTTSITMILYDLDKVRGAMIYIIRIIRRRLA